MEPEPESIAQEDGEISSSSDEEASLCSLSEGEEDPDKVEVDILSRLDSSEHLKTILRNPHLRDMLTDLDKCDDPAHMLQKAMQIPIFVEFADTCLTICGIRTDN